MSTYKEAQGEIHEHTKMRLWKLKLLKKIANASNKEFQFSAFGPSLFFNGFMVEIPGPKTARFKMRGGRKG